MSKELPYYKFYVNEWITGDITLEDYEVQGLFVNLCAYYWSKECRLTLSNAKRKFKGCDDILDSIVRNKIVKVKSDDSLVISFLDEQVLDRSRTAEKNAKNGVKGGRPPEVKPDQHRFYLLSCSNEYETFFKAGITKDTIKRRFSSANGETNRMPYKYEVLLDKIIDFNLALKLEEDIHNGFEKHFPQLDFGGRTECYKPNLEIIELINKATIVNTKTEKKPNGLFLKTQTKPKTEPITKAKKSNIEEKRREESIVSIKETIPQPENPNTRLPLKGTAIGITEEETKRKRAKAFANQYPL